MTDHALTPETLAELEDLDRHATPGPWRDADQTHGDWVGIQDQWMALGTMSGQDDALLVVTMRNHLPALIAAARERDVLARWKAEALPVMAGLQELGRALGVGLGESITARASVDLALDLRNERDAALAEVAALRERITTIVLERGVEYEADRLADIVPSISIWLITLLDDLRAALDVDTAGHDDSSERDEGR